MKNFSYASHRVGVFSFLSRINSFVIPISGSYAVKKRFTIPSSPDFTKIYGKIIKQATVTENFLGLYLKRYLTLFPIHCSGVNQIISNITNIIAFFILQNTLVMVYTNFSLLKLKTWCKLISLTLLSPKVN